VRQQRESPRNRHYDSRVLVIAREPSCSTMSRTRRCARAASGGLRPSLTPSARDGETQLRQGAGHPSLADAPDRTALGLAASGTTPARDVRRPSATPESRFERLRGPGTRHRTPTSPAGACGAQDRERVSTSPGWCNFGWCSSPREVVTTYAAINKSRQACGAQCVAQHKVIQELRGHVHRGGRRDLPSIRSDDPERLDDPGARFRRMVAEHVPSPGIIEDSVLSVEVC
jgi:hypothetical protein